mgnify:CR=1 FL=1
MANVHCRTCGLTVAQFVQPDDPMPELDPVGVVTIGRRNGAAPRIVRALMDVGCADSAGIRTVLPRGMRAWATGAWVDTLNGSMLRVIDDTPAPAPEPELPLVPVPDPHLVPLTADEEG